MANHKSAEKRIRQTETRTEVNRANRSRLRTEIKKLRTAIDSGDHDVAKKLLPTTISLIDKSVQKGILHRNTAARHKSRLSGHVDELAAAK
jgi:small subunit ribosomal protein S20